jgi:hypothetical protein
MRSACTFRREATWENNVDADSHVLFSGDLASPDYRDPELQ